MAHEHGPEEAARRYRAIVLTTLRQLRGLAETRLRLLVTPDDGHEAVRFWLLPRLADSWNNERAIFRTQGWEIDFGGNSDDFPIHASGEILCPNLGARWAHAALLGLGRTTHEVVGPAIGGGNYFHAVSLEKPVAGEIRFLPELPIILTSEHWNEALESPLGPALKRAWEEEA